MAYSTESFAGVAAQQTYTFLTLGFLSSAHLSVTVNGAPASFSINAARTQLTIAAPAIAGGETILVTRATPATEVGRIVNFQDLSHVRQSDLDTSALQLLYIAQETLDVAAGAERLELGGSGQWAGEGRKIQNLANGSASTDAATKGQLDSASIVAGNLPVVSAGDNDKSLAVVAGAWAVRTPSQMRTHFGLGSAALLTAGVGANNAVQFDGSARYPSNDGRNIDLSNNAVTTALGLRYRTTIGNVAQSSEQTPVNDATGTWAQSAASRLTPGTLTALDNSGDIVVDNAGKKVTLSAGTWEIEYLMRCYNLNAAAGNDQQLRVKVTNDDDTGAQVVYDTDNDNLDVESPGATTRALLPVHNILLLKLASGGAVVFRAANATSTDIRINTTRLVFRKVSTSTT